ncbi:hypothetical protein J7F01_29660 [Streptomyces sp. ISL-22]|uniref:hypothetical protein n=1 Tax=unclassified Streptomyces TaxID=2593676 RepID=UPI001BE50EDF|nr:MULTISPECIES: hypothetical protein [unclassified Streptomyces]MBT2416347.1 hypothetical protein [Streptomyces sp. ISL-24]MBT2436256.1 hypothetical protein [Streptomyces sp. ISL-22]
MYSVTTLLSLSPITGLVLCRRSDGRVRPVVLAALGLVAASGGFILVRALQHQDSVQAITRHDFLPPRTCDQRALGLAPPVRSNDIAAAGDTPCRDGVRASV